MGVIRARKCSEADGYASKSHGKATAATLHLGCAHVHVGISPSVHA